MSKVDDHIKSIETTIENCSISRRKKNLLYAKINKLCILIFEQVLENVKELKK